MITIFTSVSKILGLPAYLLASICWVESNHRILALNKNDGGSPSYGICQIKLKTAEYMNKKFHINIHLDEKEIMDPEINIFFAGLYIKYQLKKRSNMYNAIKSYNAGSPWKNNEKYVHDVLKRMQFYINKQKLEDLACQEKSNWD